MSCHAKKGLLKNEHLEWLQSKENLETIYVKLILALHIKVNTVLIILLLFRCPSENTS